MTISTAIRSRSFSLVRARPTSTLAHLNTANGVSGRKIALCRFLWLDGVRILGRGSLRQCLMPIDGDIWLLRSGERLSLSSVGQAKSSRLPG